MFSIIPHPGDKKKESLKRLTILFKNDQNVNAYTGLILKLVKMAYDIRGFPGCFPGVLVHVCRSGTHGYMYPGV